MPSATLLGQSLLAGVFIGGLYGLLGLGLSLSWGLLRLINLAHFALAFLGAYLIYQLVGVAGLHIVLAVLIIVPSFFVLGVAMQLLFARFSVGEFASLLVSFGMTVIIESAIQWFWTADMRKLQLEQATASLQVGTLFVPVTEALMFATAAVLSVATWAWLRFTYVGKACARAPKIRTSPPPSAWTIAASRCCSPASRRPTPVWPAPSSRCPTRCRRRRFSRGWASSSPW